jgi:hypothetical protein
LSLHRKLDCFASLAMTAVVAPLSYGAAIPFLESDH